MNYALILAGGVGTRVGANRPKQFIEIYGKPILAYTIEIYQKHQEIEGIEVVCHPMWLNYLNEMIIKYNLNKVKWITSGGNTFQDSVINGINHLKGKINDNDIIMIHYGASPFTSDEIITDGIKVCKKHEMAASCIPCFQLMGSNDENKTSKKWIDRDKLVQITCPQSFKFSYIQDIYNRAEKQELLDKIEPHTTSLMSALGDTIYQSYGTQSNIKITTKDDLELFKGYVLFKKTIID